MLDVELSTSVHLSDLILPEGVTIVALTYGEDRDIPVVSVTVRRVAEEEDEVEGEAVETDEETTDSRRRQRRY